jgi:hypothetical protein
MEFDPGTICVVHILSRSSRFERTRNCVGSRNLVSSMEQRRSFKKEKSAGGIKRRADQTDTLRDLVEGRTIAMEEGGDL